MGTHNVTHKSNLRQIMINSNNCKGLNRTHSLSLSKVNHSIKKPLYSLSPSKVNHSIKQPHDLGPPRTRHPSSRDNLERKQRDLVGYNRVPKDSPTGTSGGQAALKHP